MLSRSFSLFFISQEMSALALGLSPSAATSPWASPPSGRPHRGRRRFTKISPWLSFAACTGGLARVL